MLQIKYLYAVRPLLQASISCAIRQIAFFYGIHRFITRHL